MNEFFKFIFNFDIVDQHLRPEWIKLYDFLFIDNTIIANLQKNSELYSDLISTIFTKAQGFNIVAKPVITKREADTDETDRVEEVVPVRKVITVPEPFNLTKPKPKLFKEPIQMVSQFVMKEKPKSHEYYNKVNLDKIEQQRKDRLNIIKNVLIISLLKNNISLIYF